MRQAKVFFKDEEAGLLVHNNDDSGLLTTAARYNSIGAVTLIKSETV